MRWHIDRYVGRKETYDANLRAIVFSSIGIAVFVFLLDVLTPKKKFSALAGVFFGLFVGLLILWVLAPVVDMMIATFSENVTRLGDTFVVHDVKFRSSEWRRDFVLYHSHPGPVANNLRTEFYRLDPTYIHPHGRVEFERHSTSCRLGISKHDADLLPQLVGEDYSSVGLLDRS